MRGGLSASRSLNCTGRGAPEPSVTPAPPTTTFPPAIGSTPILNVVDLPTAVPHNDIESSTTSAPAGSSQTCGSTRKKNLSTADRNNT